MLALVRRMRESKTRRLADADRTVSEGGTSEPVVRGSGQVYGRYVVLERIGAGGMGLVYAAYDPRFDRKVALKLLWPGASTRRVALMAREARAMAQLSDPNVVQVFDVGTQDGRIWIAMELVEGPSLDTWLRERRRSWSDVLEVFLAAGQGLAAAHDAGIVHRDFKPANVLLARGSEDTRIDRVCVADFGVARATRGASGESDDSGMLRDTDATGAETSGVVGTPAFMAPEQYDTGRTDARADQFAFCVALYLALYGERPFDARTSGALMRQKLAHEVPAPPPASRVPGRLFPILLRGMHPEPDARFGSMRELLDALRTAPKRARRLRRTVAGSAVVLASAGLVWYFGADPSSSRCSGGADEVGAVWNPSRATALQAALRSSGLSYADETWTRVRSGVEAYAQAWAEAHRAVCESAATGQQPAVAMDRQMECLRRRLLRLDTLLDLLGEAEASTVQRGVEAVSGLPQISVCEDASEIPEHELPAPDDAAAVAELRGRLAKISALHDAGRYGDGRPAAAEALEQATRIGYPPLVAEAALILGRFEIELGEGESGQQHLARAAWTAAATRHDRLAAEASVELTQAAGRDSVQRGVEWSRHADASLQRIGDPPDLRIDLLLAIASLHQQRGDYEAAHEQLLAARSRSSSHDDGPTRGRIEMALGNVAYFQGRYEEAIEHNRRALEVYERGLGPQHPQVALALNALGLAHHQHGDLESARDCHERAISLRTVALGEDHPDLAGSLSNLGAVAFAEGAYEEAQQLYTRSLEIKERNFGTHGSQLIAALQSLGAVQLYRGDLEAATACLARALTIAEASRGPDHPDVGAISSNLGVAWQRRDRPDRARDYLTRALAIEGRSLGYDHPQVAITQFNLGNALADLDDPKTALTHHRAALNGFLESLGPDHRNVAQARLAIGKDLLRTGAHAEALAILRQAAHLDETDTLLAAEIDFALARAIVAAGAPRKEAIDLAERSLQTCLELGPDATEEAQAARDWLRTHQ